MSRVALDTSASVPYLMASHVAHKTTRRHLTGRELVLTGHSLAETYSVITRLPGDARVSPADAAALIEGVFGAPAIITAKSAAALPSLLAPLGIVGGAVYDALVALAAISKGVPIVSRDLRAAATYSALGADVELIADERASP